MRTLARAFYCVSFSAAFLGVAAGATAQAFPAYLNYQGKLGDPSGNPLTGTYSFRFRLYDNATAGNLLFTDNSYTGGNAVSVVNGVYSVQIGSLTAGGIPASAFFNSEVWLEIDVSPGANFAGVETLAPRERLTTSPFAFRALNASYLGTGVAIATFTTGGVLQVPYGVTAATAAFTGSVTAGSFLGDGSQLTGIPSTGSIAGVYVQKAGDSMSGPLTLIGSTLTVAGNAFSVGASTFVVAGGNVGIGTNSPAGKLHVSSGALIVDGSAGSISVAGGSVTASAFFGNGGTLAGSLLVPKLEGTSSGVQYGPYVTLDPSGLGGLGGNLTLSAGAGGNNAGNLFLVAPPGTFGAPSGYVSVQVNGGTIGTFNTGGLNLTGALSVSGSGAAVNVLTSSVNASAFFGDGSHLSGIAPPANTAYNDKDNAWSVPQTYLAASTVTIKGNAFSVGASTLVAVGGSVGIGTASPAAKLHMSSGTLLLDGTGANLFAGGTLFANAGVVIGGTAHNVSLFGSKPFEVVGDGLLTGTLGVGLISGSGGTIRLGSGGGTASTLYAPNNQTLTISADGAVTINAGTDIVGIGPVVFQVAGVEKGRFATSGYFGIGTSNPSAVLHVSSAATSAATALFLVSSGTAGGQELLRVQKDGSLGLGTSSPASKLHLSSGVLTVDGANGALSVAGGSVTASAFFGDGSHLSGILSTASANAAYVAKAGDTMTGALTFSNVAGNAITGTGTTPAISIATHVYLNGGYLGIGVLPNTSGAFGNSPFSMLSTDGNGIDVRLNNLSNGAHLGFDGASNNGNLWITSNRNSAGSIAHFKLSSFTNNKSVDMSVDEADSQKFKIKVGGAQTATIDGTDAVAVTQTGLVGIGTTNPVSKLHLSSGIVTLDGTSPGVCVGGGDPCDGTVTVMNAASAASIVAKGPNGGILKTQINGNSNAYAFFGQLGAIVPAFAGSTDITTLGPANYWYVDGNTNKKRFGVSNSGDIYFNPDSVSASTLTAAGNLTLYSSVTASAFFGDGSHLSGIAPGESNTYTSSKTFTNGAFSISSPTFVITGGNVGIGTYAPQALLSVAGQAAFGSGVAITTIASNGNIGMPNNGAVQFNNAAGNPFNVMQFNSSNQLVIQSDQPSDPIILRGNPTEAMRIQNGNVGIGSAGPAARLHVSSGSLLIDGTSPGMTIGASTFVVTGGNVGIGVAAPTASLQIQSPTATTGYAMVIATGAATSQQIVMISTGGVIYSAGGVTYAGDLAEMYPAADDAAAGDIVMLDGGGRTAFVRKAVAGRGVALGVVSTQPGMTLGTKDLGQHGARTVPVALSGRVPVKVSLENGPVLAGATLVAASRPGFAAKAVRSGPSIGVALEDAVVDASGQASVLCFVKAQYWAEPGEYQSLRREVDEIKVLLRNKVSHDRNK